LAGTFSSTFQVDTIYRDAQKFQPNTSYRCRLSVTTKNHVIFWSDWEYFTTNTLQTGPAGGYIFYDKGFYSNGWRYLEVQPFNTTMPFGCANAQIPSTTQYNVLGEGDSATAIILNNCTDPNSAARYCEDLVFGGQNDWYLPNAEEVKRYKQILISAGITGISTNQQHLSSTINFGSISIVTSNIQGYSNYTAIRRVRAIRKF